MKKSYKIAVCGICSALSVVLMFLGGILYVFSYVTPILLGVLMLMINKTFGKSCALTTFVSVSFLSIILVTEKESVLLYTLFFGYYPIIKPKLDLFKSKALKIFCKGMLFNTALFLAELLTVFVFKIPFFEGDNASFWIIALFAAAMNLIFVMYEFLLNKFYILYAGKIESRVKRLMKK